MRSKILIADSKGRPLSHPSYEFEYARDSEECLQKINIMHPDLLVIDLFLPKMDGIELLKKVNLPTIITSYQPLIQNYRAAVAAGALYFLDKPYDAQGLYKLLDLFFAGELKPAPFSGMPSFSEMEEPTFAPRLHLSSSYLKFWGTRGSSPVSGPSYDRFGGNTPCLEVRNEKDLVIIDAGTGIRPFGKWLLSSDFKTIHILFSHTHWDHIAGLPFFAPLYQKDCEIHLWSPVGYTKSLKETLLDLLAYSYFPVRLDDIQAKLVFHDLHEGENITIGNIKILTAYAYHPGATLCFKIDVRKQTFGYVTDNELLMGYHGDPKTIAPDHPLLEPHQHLVEFFYSCDTLIHEAQYSPYEYQHKIGWGHSSVSNAAVFIRYCRPKEWIVTHHDPKHTDEELQKKFQLHCDILDHLDLNTRVRMAYDDFVIPL